MMTISRNNGIQFSYIYTNMQIQQHIYIIRLRSVFWHSIKQDISVFILPLTFIIPILHWNKHVLLH